jgi:LacI family transcriptional regulator
MTKTQKDIAKRLHLSVTTVSKALANHPDISEKTQERVSQTAKKMNYRVNRIARSLVQQKTNTIGVIVPEVYELFYVDILNGIESVTRAGHYSLLLANAENNPETEIRSIQMLLENRIDGLLICPTEKEEQYLSLLKATRIPFVFFKNSPGSLQCDTVRIDRESGAYRSVRHLIERGYEEVVFFYTLSHLTESRNSVEGCRRAFRESGIPMERLRLIDCPKGIESFHRKAMEEITYSGRRIGIFAWNDEMAVGVYRAIIEKGLVIPDQVGLVGFDDIQIASFLPKALTTVRYPKFEMGKKAAEMLIRRIESTGGGPRAIKGGESSAPEAGPGERGLKANHGGESDGHEHVVLDLELVQRETT